MVLNFTSLLTTKINATFLCLTFFNLQQDIKLDNEGLSNVCLYSQDLITISEEENFNPFILSSLIYQESRWKNNLVSTKKACGLTQVLTKYLGVNCDFLHRNPDLAIQTGLHVLSIYLEHTDGNLHKALECYSTGYKCNYPKYAKSILKRAALFEEKYNEILSQYD